MEIWIDKIALESLYSEEEYRWNGLAFHKA